MLSRIGLSVALRFNPNIHTIRSSSFKAINGILDTGDTSLQSARERSSRAKSVLEEILATVHAGGGPKAIHRHTVINKKLHVHDRLKLLLDHDSPFLEIGALAGMFMDYRSIPGGGSVAGIGKINGCYCIIGANNATVKGGAFFPISVKKQIRLQQLSFLNRLPCIYLVDSGGAYLPLQAEIFPDKDHGGRTFYNEAVLSASGIPQIAVVCGSSTAGGAYCPTMAEEAIIVKKSGIIFLGGPPLVKAATGEIVSDQDLGGADVHCRISGCTDYFAETEEEAFEMCRETVLTLNIPSDSNEEQFLEPLYPIEDLDLLSGKDVLSKSDMYEILCRILDGSMFKEFKKNFGSNVITGFGFISGKLVGLIANSGYITYQDAQKGSHFIQLCDKRNVPIIFLQNSGLCDPSDDYELEAVVLKERGKLVSSHCCTKVPKICLNIGGCIRDDNFTMCGWSFQPNFLFSWPLAHTSLSSDIKTSISEDILKDESVSHEKLFENTTSAFYTSSRMLQDGIIMPQQTRKILILCVDIVTRKSFQWSETRSTFSILRM